MAVEFTVPTDPLPQPRPRFSNGRAYQPRRILEYKDQVRLAAMVAMRGIKPFSKRVLANIRLYRKFSPVSRSFGDVDNLVKSICDALNGIAYNDDSQIVDLIVGKYQDAANPRAEIFLEELDDILLE